MPTKIYNNSLNVVADTDSIDRYINSDQISIIRYNDNNDMRATQAVNASDYSIQNIRGIFGIPYQFRYTEDPRINSDNGTIFSLNPKNKNNSNGGLGAKYAQKIVSKMPLLFLIPCKQKFMAGYDKETQGSTLSALIEQLGGGSGDNWLNQVIDKNGRYYTTIFKWADYYKYVNLLCHTMAAFMGLDNISVPTKNGSKLVQNLNWQEDFRDENLFNLTNPQKEGSILFYVDGGSITEMSESFSNSTTDSSLASSINGYSDQVNEIRFLLGEGSGIESMMNKAAEDINSGIISGLGDAFSGLTGKMLSDLASSGTSTILSGGKLVFPKIWQDSSFSRSYSFNIKLRSPDHDNLSIYFNIMVPYLHLLALTLPVSHEDNANSYTAPFLVKAYCKGLFNIQDGIITDLSVTRGGECQWNDDGLPTQMDISISIEDLYSSLFMSSLNDFKPPILINQIKNAWSFVNNTGMMDYLANLSGLNVAEEDIARTARMIVKMCNPFDVTVATANDTYNLIDQGIATMIKKLYF